MCWIQTWSTFRLLASLMYNTRLFSSVIVQNMVAQWVTFGSQSWGPEFESPPCHYFLAKQVLAFLFVLNVTLFRWIQGESEIRIQIEFWRVLNHLKELRKPESLEFHLLTEILVQKEKWMMYKKLLSWCLMTCYLQIIWKMK